MNSFINRTEKGLDMDKKYIDGHQEKHKVGSFSFQNSKNKSNFNDIVGINSFEKMIQ